MLPLKMTFKIENPEHNEYINGALTFVFDEKMPTVLNKIDFVIDGKPYYINLIRLPTQNLTWIFQNPRSLNALSREEIDRILLLSSDVIKRFEIRTPTKRILEVLPCQAEIYLKIMDKTTTKEDKKVLIKELNSQNMLLKHMTAMRHAKLVSKAQTDLSLHEEKQL